MVWLLARAVAIQRARAIAKPECEICARQRASNLAALAGLGGAECGAGHLTQPRQSTLAISRRPDELAELMGRAPAAPERPFGRSAMATQGRSMASADHARTVCQHGHGRRLSAELAVRRIRHRSRGARPHGQSESTGRAPSPSVPAPCLEPEHSALRPGRHHARAGEPGAVARQGRLETFPLQRSQAWRVSHCRTNQQGGLQLCAAIQRQQRCRKTQHRMARFGGCCRRIGV